MFAVSIVVDKKVKMEEDIKKAAHFIKEADALMIVAGAGIGIYFFKYSWL